MSISSVFTPAAPAIAPTTLKQQEVQAEQAQQRPMPVPTVKPSADAGARDGVHRIDVRA